MLIWKILRGGINRFKMPRPPYSLRAELPPGPESAAMIDASLRAKQPLMIARLGAVESQMIANYLGVRHPGCNKYRDYLFSYGPAWEYNPRILNSMSQNAGFFPKDIVLLEKFCIMMLRDMKQVDILGSWRWEEKLFSAYFPPEMKNVRILNLEPFWFKPNWLQALKGKSVLVIHPFATTIARQYSRRKLLFGDADFLPEFELKILPAIQSIGGYCDKPYSTWFDALNAMKQEVANEDFDVALIGCGAYGFPLAAEIKRMGKKAFHLGGSLQLLFGILGQRWMNQDYGSQGCYNYKALFNENWCRPLPEDTPPPKCHIKSGTRLLLVIKQ